MTEVLDRETGELTESGDEEERIAEQMTPDAEPEQPDDDTDDDTDDEPEPPAPSPSQAPPDIEQRFRKLEQSAGTYARRVGELLDFMTDELAPCLLCSSTPHLGFLNVSAAGTMPQEMKDAVMMYLGFPREQEYEPARNISACDVCAGRGKVSTGSRVPGNESTLCPNCVGYGYYPPPAAAEGVAGKAPIGHAPAGEAVPPLATEDVDVSGEPRYLPDGRPNPNFGMWPQYKIQVPPWGTTAGLTAQDATA